MSAENEPRRRDEASSTRARTIAVACRNQTGPRDFRGGCQKTVTKTYREEAGRSRQTMPLHCIADVSDSRITPSVFSSISKQGTGNHARASARGAITEEILHLREEARRFGLRLTRRQLLELGQQLLLLPRQILRGLDHDLNIHVAGLS